MDLDGLTFRRAGRKEREAAARKGTPRPQKNSHAGRQAKSRKGHTIVRAPTEADNVSNAQGGMDDIYGDDSPRRLRDSGYESNGSRFSEGEAASTECHFDREIRRGKQEEQRKVEQKRQRQKEKLAEAQRQREQPECIDLDHEEEERVQPSSFYKDPEKDKGVKELMQKYGHEDDYDELVAEENEKGKQRKKGKGHPGNNHGASAFAGCSLSAPNGGRMRSRDRRHQPRSHLEGHNRVLPNHSSDPLDIARIQQEADSPRRSSSSRARGGDAGENRRGKGGSFTKGVGNVMEQIQKWGNGGMGTKREKQAEAALKRQTANEHTGGQSSGEKRKSDRRSSRRHEGPFKRTQLSPKGSSDNAIDVDDDDSAIDQNNQSENSFPQDGGDLMAAIEGSGSHYVGQEDYRHLNADKNDSNSSEWEDGGAKDANFGITRAPQASNRSTKANGKKKGNAVSDMNGYLRGTTRAANSDNIVEITSPASNAKLIARAGKPNVNERIPKKSEGWVQESAPWIPRNERKERKPTAHSTKLLKKIKSQGGRLDDPVRNAWGEEFEFDGSTPPRSSSNQKSNQPKRKGRRQTKLHETRPRRQTRSRSKPRKEDNEVITIDSSSDEDEMSTDGSLDLSQLSTAKSRPRGSRAPGERASIDAVRIAVGKRVFKSKCQLSLQPGTNNPYILFTYFDSKGKKCEHSVYLKDEELKEVKYFIDGEEDTDDAGDIDDDTSMTVIAFRITPTDKNNFARYSNAYDQVDENEDAENTEKRYIVVEVRDTNDFQAMLAQMREHPTLEVWCGADSKIPSQDLATYTQAFLEDNRKEKAKRMSVARRTRSGGVKKEKKASENKLLLVYPFDAEESILTEAAANLTELGGDLLGVECASVAGSPVDADAAAAADDTDQSDGGGDVSDSKGKSTRTHYITIREDDKDRLSPGQFLNDSLVDFWMRWISRGEPQQSDSDVHFFTSHFMTTLKDEGPEAVASWTAKKKINIFKKKLIFIPVNADLHWSLCVIVNPGLVANNFDENLSSKEEHAFILFLDSLKMHNRKLYSRHIRNWLNCEWKRLQKKKIGGTIAPFASNDAVPMCSPRIPYQDNGCDCGVFVCRYAYNLYTMRHQKFTWEAVEKTPYFSDLITKGPAFQFGMADIARIREEIAMLIDNLSKHYIQMKEEEKARKRAAKKAAMKSDSTLSGDADVADAPSEKDGTRSEATPAASDDNGGFLEGAGEAKAQKDGDEDVTMSSSEEKENVENVSQDASQESVVEVGPAEKLATPVQEGEGGDVVVSSFTSPTI